MHRRQLLAASAAAATGIALAVPATAQTTNDESQASLDTVMAFMGAMGGGDMDSMGALMADYMVWQNEGDPDRMRWVAPAPPASNVPKCSCHKLLRKEPPDDS